MVHPKRILLTQVFPEIFDPRKVDTNFFEDNFEYFRALETIHKKSELSKLFFEFCPKKLINDVLKTAKSA